MEKKPIDVYHGRVEYEDSKPVYYIFSNAIPYTDDMYKWLGEITNHPDVWTTFKIELYALIPNKMRFEMKSINRKELYNALSKLKNTPYNLQEDR